MEKNDYTYSRPAGAGRFDSGGRIKPHTPPASSVVDDSINAYVEKNIDVDVLAGDIKEMVAERLRSSIPDEKRLMMDLVAQVGELTGEVKELRKQLDSKPYAVFTCPSGQMKDISGELAEIRQLLQQEPRPRELSVTEIDPIILGPARHESTQTNVPPPPPMQQPAPEVTAEAPPSPPPNEQAAGTANAFAEQMAPKAAPQKVKKKKTALSIIGNILFYVVILGIVAGAFLAKSGSGGQPTMVAGYSAFTVLSSSMEDTYPKGSLIVTRTVDPNELQVGDDITYMASATTSITHRIISITENYLSTGARAFETQGTMNENPDKEPVAAANVVGKVIFCSVLLGQAAAFISTNWPLLIFFAVVLAALFAFLKWNFRREDEKTQSAQTAAAGTPMGKA